MVIARLEPSEPVVSLHHFSSVRQFLAAADAAGGDFARFDAPSHLADRWCDFGQVTLDELLSDEVLDAVVTADGYVFLDSGQLASYAKERHAVA